MNKSIAIIATLVVVFFSNTLSANQNNKTLFMYPKGKTYSDVWQSIESLENQGLVKSAMEKAQGIFAESKKENNTNQFLKSLIYIMTFENSIGEKEYADLISLVNAEVQTASFPSNAIMHSMLAEMYWTYFQNNRWNFYNRTNTVNFDSGDLKTWSLEQIIEKTIFHYKASLNDKDSLQNTSVENFGDIIYYYSELALKLRSSLYDFLAFRAVDFFSLNEASITKPIEEFQLDNEIYFAPIEKFAAYKIETTDNLSLKFHATAILQDIAKFHLQDSEKSALLDADLYRLKFVYANSNSEIKDSLYFQALEALTSKYAQNNGLAETYYEKAKYYYNRGKKYVPSEENTFIFKDDLKKAMAICDETIKNFQEWSMGGNLCKQLKLNIESKYLSFESEQVIPSQHVFTAKISYKNIPKIYCKLTALSQKAIDKIYDEVYNSYDYSRDHNIVYFEKLIAAARVIEEKSFEMPEIADLNNHSTEALFKGLAYGTYILFIANNSEFDYDTNTVSYSIITVSDISYTKRITTEGKAEIYVFNRLTGEPMAGVNIKATYTQYNEKTQKNEDLLLSNGVTNAQGYYTISKSEDYYKNNLSLEFSKGEDLLSSKSILNLNHYPNYNSYSPSEFFFTDRAIYRPGQKVYFKGISFYNRDGNASVYQNYKITVSLTDVNEQVIGSVDLVTNEYGTVSGSFDIPKNVLTGQMKIQTHWSEKYIQVEEYKRPKFEVTVKPLDGNYLLNEKITINALAKAFSGATISDATVKYSITRTPVYSGWWSYYYKAEPKIIANGKLETNDNGECQIVFTAVPDLNYPKNGNISFNYSVVIDVTDINGETQSYTQNITVGYAAMKISCIMPKMYDVQKGGAITLLSQNLNGEAMPAKGEIKIFKLVQPQQALRGRYWSSVDQHLYDKQTWNSLYSGNEYAQENTTEKQVRGKLYLDKKFDTEQSKTVELPKLSSWETGTYLVEAISKDAFGNEINTIHYFTLFNSESKTCPYATTQWIQALKTTGEPGDSASFLIASSEKITVLVEVEHQRTIVESKFISIDKEQKILNFPILEKHRGNFSIHFTMVKNNRLITKTETVTVPYSNKQLKLSFETFRNKLSPGEKEEWRIKIQGPLGEKVAAEMLATLYDASLDQFVKNYWDFSVYPSYAPVLRWSSRTFITTNAQTLEKSLNPYHSAGYMTYAVLNWHNFGYVEKYRSYPSGMMKSAKSAAYDKEEVYEEKAVEMSLPSTPIIDEVQESPNEIEKKEEVGAIINTTDSNTPPTDLSSVKLRSNFNETAFFYPNLVTDEEGNVIVKFTIPESLTRWKMMGMAHTQDVKYGFIENELVTQKDLMVVPNVPRFFREGDKMQFQAKVTNLSGNDLTGVAQLQFFDALTMQPVKNIIASGSEQQNFTIGGNKNVVLYWSLSIPDNVQALTYRIVAKAGNFSDGEENVVPVLTNRMLVTESLPLPMSRKGTKTFTLDKLINSGASTTLKHNKLTLEFTSNPAWYAVQALPYIMEYPYECAEQTFSRFYANSIASHIVNSSPRVKQIFDSWKNTPDSKALLSNLEKNQELKSVLLQETPWVLESDDETERKKRVGLLFDLNRIADENERALNKIIKAQTSNGGWAWFEGMKENRYISQHIIGGMGHLDRLGVLEVRDNAEIWSMIENGVKYLDNELQKDYEEWLRYKKKHPEASPSLGSLQLHYFYCRSFFMNDFAIKNEHKIAYDFFKDLLGENWLNQSNYMKGYIALCLHRVGKTELAKNIVKSLSEHAIHSEEFGMYWKENIWGYYWYQSPIETQALMIELYDEVAQDIVSVNEMKIWLLKQKQTQDWKTTKATTEAIYALLLRGADWIANTKLAEVKVGDIVVDPSKLEGANIEAGTGYFKTSWSGNEIQPNMGKVTVTNPNEGVAWGALYWQYFEQLDKITPHETPLKLKKQLFLERQTDKGAVLNPLTEETTLAVGDKVIVRIELRVDRDMEYIHMKDMRASGFEPINVISSYKYQDGLGYYEATKDAATNFFIADLPQGTYVFEYPLRVSHQGDFSNGITTIQCMYAPEFTSHSEGVRVKVK
ncbi:MAG: hypothetical protein IPO21_07210 [Bacteroidales bacterium]|nr:hypothetical protein [Bacteroidales bacterium]